MNDYGIRFVVFRYNHHSPHSGYSRLAEYGAAHFNGEIISVAKPLPRSIIRERMLWRLAAGTPGYDRASMAAELKVAWNILSEGKHIYHFLYGEKTYRYVGRLNDVRQNRVVATFHFPPTGIRNAVQIDGHIRKLSAAICVGRNQQQFFADKLDPDRVFFVPLGVDTEYFTPPISSGLRDPNLCVFVGENYRDFPTLRGVIELVTYLRPETKFVIVTRPPSFKLIGEHPNMTFRSGVPEPELRELYRSAALMVMPLHDATANNAILEAMACGLPMVVSDAGAIQDYVGAAAAALVPPHESRKMAETVLALLDEPGERERMSVEARKQALDFAWPKMVDRLTSVYKSVI